MSAKPLLPRPTEMAHRLLREHLKSGDTAVDATLGNGHDTAFLAECVGATGRVIGIDVQREAVERSQEKLKNYPDIVFHCESHENIDQIVSESVAAITFNLGYLPGGDKSLITRAESTLVALQKSIGLLERGGLLTIVAYLGHAGGTEEGLAVSEWASELDQDAFSVIRYEFQNQRNSPPFLLAVERR